MQLNCDLDSIEEQNEHQEKSVKFKAPGIRCQASGVRQQASGVRS